MPHFIPILVAAIAGSATAFRVPAAPRGGADITAPTDVPTAPKIPRAEPTQFHAPNAFGAPGADHVGAMPDELLFARAADPTLMEVPGASYMGCFQDGSNEVLSVTQITEFSLTPELCRNLCQIQLSASSGLGYFGLENGYYCFCGTNIAQFAVQAPESECSEACDGQSTVLCGGKNRIGIYSITSTVPGGQAGATGTSGGGGGGGGSASEVTVVTTDASGSTITSTSTTTKAATSSGSGSSSSSSSSPSLSIGAIVGIAIGGVVVGALVVGVIAWRLLKRNRNSMPQMQYAPPPPPSGPYGGPGTPQQQYAPLAPGYAAKQEGHVAYQQTPPPQPVTGSVSPANQGAYAPPPGPPPQQQQAPQEMGDGVYEIGHYYNR